jgi:hypothetical protein
MGGLVMLPDTYVRQYVPHRHAELIAEADKARLVRAATAGSPSLLRRGLDLVCLALLGAGQRLHSQPVIITILPPLPDAGTAE